MIAHWKYTKSLNTQSVTQWVCDLWFVDKSWRCSLVQIKTIINVFLVLCQFEKSHGCGLAISASKYIKKNNTNSNKIRVILCMTILKKKCIYTLYTLFDTPRVDYSTQTIRQMLLALLYESSINQSLHHSFRHLLASKTLFKIRPC